MTDLTTRAAALLAAADKMTPGEWRYYTEPQPNGCPIIGSRGLMVAMLAHSVRDVEQAEEAIGNAAGIVALRNEAPALIRELLAENERLRFRDSVFRDQGGSVAGGKTIAERYKDEADRLRARVAELEAPTLIDEAKDAGPSPFQGRTTRRDEDDDKEYNFMMSHYEGRS